MNRTSSETPLTAAEKRHRLAVLRKRLSASAVLAKKWKARLKRAFTVFMKTVERCERLERAIDKLS